MVLYFYFAPSPKLCLNSFTMVKIVQREDPVLRQVATPVLLKDIGSKTIKRIIKDMVVAVTSQDDGIAIAAPQIGVSLRIFVVSKRLFEVTESKLAGPPRDLVFINPEITKRSREQKEMEEGCLSVRYLYGKVRRSAKATISAYDETGKKITIGASGLLAQVFQHEVDHLDGKLFTDRAKSLEEILPETTTSNHNVKP